MMIKKTLYLLIFLFSLEISFSQEVDSSQKYIFINYSADTLIFNTVHSNLNYFFQKYDSLIQTGKGEINIMHIGGSHVQAGILPHTIRHQLLLSHPNIIGNRGMIFPYSAAPRSNNPGDYQVRSTGSFEIIRNVFSEHIVPLGITGAALITADSTASIKIILKDSLLKFNTEKVILLGYCDSIDVIPSLFIDSTEYFPVSFDTILKRYVFEPQNMTDSFLIKFNNYDNERFIINGIYLDNSAPGISYHSIGVNGASVPSYNRCAHFSQDLDLINPDLVIFGIGINDASGPNFNPLEFEQNYLQLMDTILKHNPNCSFIFVTNNDSFIKTKVKYKRKGKWRTKTKWVNNSNGKEVQQVMFMLAEKTNSAVFDQFEIMGGATSMLEWEKAGLAQKDKVHFTKNGYVLMGNLFYQAFNAAFKNMKQSQMPE
jgi:lysophospholipase L1-like esterase